VICRGNATKWTAALAAAAALIAGCGSNASSSGSGSGSGSTAASGGTTLHKSTIVLGNIGTYSGPFGAQYADSLKGLQAWAQWTTEHGGLNGHPVKIVSIDDLGSTTNALAGAKRLVEADHAVAILDAMTPNTDSAYAPYVQSQHIPVVGGIPLDANWITNPYFFPTGANSVGFLTGQFNLVKKAGGKKLGIFLCQFAACDAGIPLFQQITRQLGIAYAGAQSISSAASTYAAQCLKFRTDGVDTVIPELDGPTTVHVIESCAQQGYHPKVVVPSSDLDAAAMSNSAFAGAFGVTESPLWFGPAAQSQIWYKAYKQLYPNDTPTGFATLGWQAGVVVAAALARAPGTVTPADVLAGLWSLPPKDTFGGWTPALTYAKLKPATTAPCIWVTEVRNGTQIAPDGTGEICAG
jgi:branched-chain amino acid transport system substrate-binding protein